jgi:predicted nuclease of predicted toxin-antitoxin system
LKLLVDENLAPELAKQLADLFPGSVPVTSVGLGSTSDAVIWEYAGANQFTFLTKDKDPLRRSSASSGPTPFAFRNSTGMASAACFF